MLIQITLSHKQFHSDSGTPLGTIGAAVKKNKSGKFLIRLNKPNFSEEITKLGDFALSNLNKVVKNHVKGYLDGMDSFGNNQFCFIWDEDTGLESYIKILDY